MVVSLSLTPTQHQVLIRIWAAFQDEKFFKRRGGFGSVNALGVVVEDGKSSCSSSFQSFGDDLLRVGVLFRNGDSRMILLNEDLLDEIVEAYDFSRVYRRYVGEKSLIHID